MLDEFDSLAVAELDTTDAAEQGEGVDDMRTTPPALAEVRRRTALGGWDWVIGACVLGLVVLAARR